MQPHRQTLLPLSLTALLCLSSLSSAATVIYQHSFSGSSTATLNGVALDTSNAILGGTSGATWTSSDFFHADGSHDNTIGSGTNHHSAYVPFTPVSGYIYTISIAIDITSASTNRWIALSLTDSTPLADGSSFATTTGGADYASIARRDTAGNNLLRRAGANGNGGSDTTSTLTGIVAIRLDTTNPSQWTYQWSDDGTTFGTTYNFGATGNIDFIRISSDGNVTGTIDNFSVTAVPEPGFTLLSTLGAGLLTLRRSRRNPSLI